MNVKNIIRHLVNARNLVIAATMAMALTATNASAQVGASGWTIFKKAQTVNTRGITALTGTSSNLSSVFTNPSLLATKTQPEAFFLSEAGFAGDYLGGILYGQPLKNGMIAGGLVGYDAGSIELNWLDNGQLKTENARAQQDYLGIVSYGQKLKKDLLVGGTLKMASSRIADRASALAFAGDIGVAWLPTPNLMFTSSLQNIGFATKFVDEANPLPTTLSVSGGYAMKVKDYRILTGLGVSYNMVDNTFAPEIGMEFRYNTISMSVGYKFDRTESALQLGLGVNWGNVEFGYAYVPGIYLDTTHRVNVTYRFTSLFGSKTGDTSAKPAPKPAAPTASAPLKTPVVNHVKLPAKKTVTAKTQK